MNPPPGCPECGATIGAIRAEVNPRTIALTFRAQCGHEIDRDVADTLWRAGYRWAVPLIDGTSLVAAERVRHVTEEGFTPAHDAERAEGLPWAAWSYLDRAMHPSNAEDPPSAWPWPVEEWNTHADPLRRLVIAGSLIAAEIDRQLAEQRGAKP